MIVFTEDSHRDLMGKEAAAAGAGKKQEATALPAGAVKKEAAAGASELRVPLACLFPIESTAEARPAGAGKKRKAAVAAELGDGALNKDCDSLFKEGEMLKLRAEYWEAALLWEEKLVPGALDRWLERKLTQDPAVHKTKKKKVVRIITPNAYMEDIIENPDVMEELSDEEMAKCPEQYRQSYAIAKIINAKNHAYQQASSLSTELLALPMTRRRSQMMTKRRSQTEEVVMVKN